MKLNIETISCRRNGVLCISVQKPSATRRRFKWNKAQKDAKECVWTSDEEDVISVPGKSRETGKEKGEAGAIHKKKRGKSAERNRSQKETIECGWDSDAVFGLTECRIPVQKLRAKKRLEWNRDPKGAHECVWDSDADKSREIEKTVLGQAGATNRKKKGKRAKWNKPQKDAAESAWDSDTILDD